MARPCMIGIKPTRTMEWIQTSGSIHTHTHRPLQPPFKAVSWALRPSCQTNATQKHLPSPSLDAVSMAAEDIACAVESEFWWCRYEENKNYGNYSQHEWYEAHKDYLPDAEQW